MNAYLRGQQKSRMAKQKNALKHNESQLKKRIGEIETQLKQPRISLFIEAREIAWTDWWFSGRNQRRKQGMKNQVKQSKKKKYNRPKRRDVLPHIDRQKRIITAEIADKEIEMLNRIIAEYESQRAVRVV